MINQNFLNKLQQIFESYCNTVVQPLFSQSAECSAKNKPGLNFQNEVSYPTHIINAVFTSTTIYIHEHPSSLDEQELLSIKLLMSTLTLHDVGKYLENKHKIFGGNSKDNIDEYFKTDDFHLRIFFPNIDNPRNRNEIDWLIQHTELDDPNNKQTMNYQSNHGRLADYCRIGDKVASLSKGELYISDIYNKALKSREDIHIVQIPKIPQYLIHREILKTIKKHFENLNLIPFLLFENGFFYIQDSNTQTTIDKEQIEHILVNNISTLLDPVINELSKDENEDDDIVNDEEESDEQQNILSLRINNQQLEDSSILKSPLSSIAKKRLIQKEILNGIKKGLNKGFQISIPLDTIIQQQLATIIYLLYKKGPDDLNDKEILVKSNEYKNNDSIGTTKFKMYVTKELFENFRNYNINIMYRIAESFLDEQIEKNSNMEFLTDLVNNISIDFKNNFSEFKEVYPGSKKEICFLCGTGSSEPYKAGQGFFIQSRRFSKRGRINDKDKKICRLCQLEIVLSTQLLKSYKYKENGDYLFAVFYFDKIFPNISYFSQEFSNVPLDPNTHIILDENKRFRLGNFDQLYYVMPFKLTGKNEPLRQNNRINITRQILQFIKAYGCKAVISSNFTILRFYNEIFVNEDPIKLELTLNSHKISRFTDLDPVLDFLTLINIEDKQKGYYKVQYYNPFLLIHFLKTTLNIDRWVKKNYIDVVKECFGDKMIKIEQLALKGKELYGNIYGSSYKKTVLMRTALDYILMCLQQNLSEDELKMYVSGGLYKLAMREEYAKKRNVEQYINAFIQELIEYLKENNWYNVPALNSIEKYLIDTYEFALLSIGKGSSNNEQ